MDISKVGKNSETSLLTNTEDQKTGLIDCFVIMPFSGTTDSHTSEYWIDHFEKFLKPQIEQSGKIRCFRSQALREDILVDIISSLIRSPILVADLTDHNANVFWELGVRQSFRHRTITIAETETRLPFDVKSKGTLFYHPQNHIKNETFVNDFQNALKDCLEFPNKPDSIVLEAIGGRGSLYQIIEKDRIIRQIDGLLDETDYNINLINKIRNHVREKLETIQDKEKKTLKDRGPKLAVFNRIRLKSVEYLMISRYITADHGFYELIEEYYNLITLVDTYIKDLASLFSTSQVTINLILNKSGLQHERLEILRNEIERHKEIILEQI